MPHAAATAAAGGLAAPRQRIAVGVQASTPRPAHRSPRPGLEGTRWSWFEPGRNEARRTLRVIVRAGLALAQFRLAGSYPRARLRDWFPYLPCLVRTLEPGSRETGLIHARLL